MIFAAVKKQLAVHLFVKYVRLEIRGPLLLRLIVSKAMVLSRFTIGHR